MAATYNDDGTVNVMNLHEVARTNAGDLACCIGKPKKTHKNIEKRKAFTLAFEPLPARYHRNNKSGIPLKGIPDLLLALAVMIDTMHLDAPSNMIIRHLFSEQVLMYCLTSAPD